MSTKKSDDKAIVSFSSDSDEDESSSSSSSSKLSSSASSEDESETETVTIVVPLPPSSQVSSQRAGVEAAGGVGAGERAAKEEGNARVATKNRDTVKAVNPESIKSPGAEAKDAAKDESIKAKDKLTSESIQEVRKSPGKQPESINEQKMTKKSANSVSVEGFNSPKITANDVEEKPLKQTKRIPEDDVTVTTNKATKNNQRGSPKKTSNDEEAQGSKRVVATRKEYDAEEDAGEVTKTTLSGSKLTAERAKSPKGTSEEPVSVAESKSIDRAKSSKKGVTGDKEIERAKSPKKTVEETDAEQTKSPKKALEVKDAERAKSPKKTVQEDMERARSPKKTLDDQDAEGTKSPKKTSVEKDTERAKSPKTSSKDSGEVKKKSVKDSSKTPCELLRSVESPEKSPSRTIKAKNSSTTEDESSTIFSSGKSQQKKDLEGKKPENQETTDAADPAKPKKASKKTMKSSLTAENGVDPAAEKRNTKDQPEKITELEDRPRENRNITAEAVQKQKALSTGEARQLDVVGSTPAERNTARDRSPEVPKSGVTDKSGKATDESPKIGVSEAKTTDSRDTTNEVELLLKEIRQKRVSQMSTQPGPGSETPESGNKSIRVTVDDLGKTDDASNTLSNVKTDTEMTDKDYIKVTSSSRTPAADDGTGSKPDLENEESEFTYRRKSMDEFIKRILAEAREERLKQKRGASSSEASEDDRKQGMDGYAERNGGDLTENGLDRSKRNSGGSSGDRDGSMLDRRLAIIEKRRFGGSADPEKGSLGGAGAGGGGGIEGGRAKVGKETEQDAATNRTTKSLKDAPDYDVNLDEDLEEINRFLQSRKSAASRFDFDEPGQNDDASTPNTTKRRLATGKEQQQQPEEEDDLPPSGPKSRMKKYSMDLDFDDDDERFLGRFKREEDSALPEDSFAPRRRDETGEVIKERTRNVRVLVDQQVEIVHAMRSTSKSLDELEREIREVRQVCLDRRARIEALEGELGAEYRAFENDQMAASDRQQQQQQQQQSSTDGLMMTREDFAAASFGRIRRQDKFKSGSLDEENFPFRRRSGSVTSTTSHTSGFDGRGRLGDGSNDAVDFRPPSGLKQSRRTSENESHFSSSGLDRRRGGSVTGDRNIDMSSFGSDDSASALLSQRPARSRASIATSNPTVDYAGSISGDSFLAKIRAKYSFLAPLLDNQSFPGSVRGQGSSSFNSSSVTSDPRYGRYYGSRDLLSSPSSVYSTLGTGFGGYSTTGRYSTRDTRSPSYSTGGFTLSSSSSGGISSGYGDSSRMRRAQSVSEVSFDRHTVSPTNLGSSGGSEFHSRFLDKVRGKKAMGEDSGGGAASKGEQEKPFKSRFLKTTSFDAGSSSLYTKSDRLMNGFDERGNAAAGEHTRGSSGVNGNA